MKIYYTQSQIKQNDYSYYGVFAVVDNDYYQLTEIGTWKKATRPEQIQYYKTCKKLDIQEYVANMSEPQTVQMFQRTKGRENNTNLALATSTTLDNSYTNEPLPVLCTMPDGGLIVFSSRDTRFERIVDEKGCCIKAISPRYTQDGNYTMKPSNTQMAAKDFVDDAISLLEDVAYGEKEMQ